MTEYIVQSTFRAKDGSVLRRNCTFKGDRLAPKHALVAAHKAMGTICAADPRIDSISSTVKGANGEEICTTDFADELGCGISSQGLMNEITPGMIDAYPDLAKRALDTVLTDEQRHALAERARDLAAAGSAADGIFNKPDEPAEPVEPKEEVFGTGVVDSTFPVEGVATPGSVQGSGNDDKRPSMGANQSNGSLADGDRLDNTPVRSGPDPGSHGELRGRSGQHSNGGRGDPGGFAPRQGKTYGGTDITRKGFATGGILHGTDKEWAKIRDALKHSSHPKLIFVPDALPGGIINPSPFIWDDLRIDPIGDIKRAAAKIQARSRNPGKTESDAVWQSYYYHIAQDARALDDRAFKQILEGTLGKQEDDNE